MKNSKSHLVQFSLIANPSNYERKKCVNSNDCYQILKPLFEDSIAIYESFYILTLNRANVCTGFAKISQGGIIGTVVDLRIIAKIALDSLATSIILAHNHPSGNLNPSTQDLEITRKISSGLKLLDISVLDHIILSPLNNYYSMADMGVL